MICYKIHSSATGEVLAACDAELLEKKLKNNGIDFYITKAFYGKEKIGKEEFKEILKEHTNINLVGEKTVKAAIEVGLATENNIKRISGVPHLQIYIIE
ncbi:MAG: DUF424 family protein [Candidatus Diapherotrites archaeon]|nr:DUF424 family protein [Candidatus Diapherotrites archaeon]